MAVSQGRWMLIEDIDKAPIEILSVLLPLIESRELFIASRGERIQAKEGFRLFATRSSEPGIGHPQLGENLWTPIKVEPYPDDEIKIILQNRYPVFSEWSELLFSAFVRVQNEFKVNKRLGSGGRSPSLRDLIKWSDRCVVRHAATQASVSKDPTSFLEQVFQEGVDCFIGYSPNSEFCYQICSILGQSLNLSQHRIDFYVNHYEPQLQVSETHFKVGRSSIAYPVNKNAFELASSSQNFAATFQSKRLLERLVTCVDRQEPVLLVGETGTGKTTVTQYLASQLGKKLIVFNMSQQSDSSDLLGGFKPVDIRVLANPLRETFLDLFGSTFSVKSNQVFLDSVQKAYSKKKWKHFSTGLWNAVGMAKKLMDVSSAGSESSGKKLKRQLDDDMKQKWIQFEEDLGQFDAQREQIKDNLLFSFVDGALIKAIQAGHWVLLDEVNLASAETLECLNGLLQSPESSILLMEKGDSHAVQRHPDFRIFACMNPANDAGKRDLTPSLRSRFTEFWIDAPDSNLNDLLNIVKQYLRNVLPPSNAGEQIVLDVTEFHMEARRMASEGLIYDGAQQRVHFSMRTLSRSLIYSIYITPSYGIRRALYEGICMTYLTGLDTQSTQRMETVITSKILNTVKNQKSFLQLIPKEPIDKNADHVLVGSFWLECGPFKEQYDKQESNFILTQSVEKNLNHLSRAIVSRKYPVLIQGPTSVGKTSIIEYLAHRTGHRFVRINNHEHTDIQEYLGSYISNENGALVFQEVRNI